MQFLYNIEDRLLDELKTFSTGEQKPMTAQDLDNLKDMSDVLVNITEYCAMKTAKPELEGFSNAGNSGYSRGGQGRYNRMGMSNAYPARGGRSYRGNDDWEYENRMMYQMRPEMY